MKYLQFILLMASLSGYSAFAQGLLDYPEAKIAQEFLNAVRDKNKEATHRLLHEDVIWHQPGNNILSGHKTSATTVFAMSHNMHTLSHGTLQLKDYQILAVNGNQVVCELHFTAARPEGAVLDVKNVDIYTIENGKITKAQIFSADPVQEDYFWGK